MEQTGQNRNFILVVVLILSTLVLITALGYTINRNWSNEDKLEDSISQIESSIVDLKSSLELMKTKLNNLDEVDDKYLIEYLEELIEDQEDKIDDLEEDIKDLESSLTKKIDSIKDILNAEGFY